MFSNKIFAERIRLLRKQRNIKQSELGEMVGLTYTAISDIERGRRTTTIEKLVALADYFEVSIDYLVGRTDNPEINR
ncbi:helix-turn-helix domain-containing protein [Schnuerera ultunensis]|uniref:Predicted transcriptional regulator n=1 Tax=[Clostridium] ultunense Esp TaxID=1288971 RepID=A0A1M4PLE1_9FIRM|nr:helix-turn-helix transcriptional regulator [Schnuerera ultunensis]SHD76244.1 Predicted transcriptional regulator [[Clostridium] ultunense Esp]